MTYAFFNPAALPLYIIITIMFVWLGYITYQSLSLQNHYKQLTSKSNKKDLQEILTQILSFQKNQDKVLAEFQKHLETLETESSFHLQSIGFVRFNPFSDTGGEQSFVLSLLDKHKNGIVLTFLHNRDTTRVYTKHVIKGKSQEIALSDEEQKAIANAQVLR